jgi:hypothetical protein
MIEKLLNRWLIRQSLRIKLAKESKDADRCATCQIKHIIPVGIYERVCKACKQNPAHY